MTYRLLTGFAFVLAASTAAAAPIYRCGNTYSQLPCPEGGKVVEATDPRSAAQRAEARRLAAAERKAADERERERKARDAAAQTAPGALSPAPAADAASAASGKGPARAAAKAKPARAGKDFVATVPREKAAGK